MERYKGNENNKVVILAIGRNNKNSKCMVKIIRG